MGLPGLGNSYGCDLPPFRRELYILLYHASVAERRLQLPVTSRPVPAAAPRKLFSMPYVSIQITNAFSPGHAFFVAWDRILASFGCNFIHEILALNFGLMLNVGDIGLSCLGRVQVVRRCVPLYTYADGSEDVGVTGRWQRMRTARDCRNDDTHTQSTTS